MITYRKNKYYLLMIINTINKKDEFRMKFALSISISIRNLIFDSFPVLLPGTYG